MVVSAASLVVNERQLGELSTADLGQRVQVEAVVKSLRTFSGGLVGTLDDGTGTATLLLWQEVCDGLTDPAELVPGAVLRVEGEVVDYQGEIEIVPRAPADIMVVGMVELPVQEVAIGQLSANDLGQTVQVDGRIAAIAPFSKGTKYTLDDGTGTITLLLWQNIYDGQADPALLAIDTWLRVRGTVAEYLGDLELVPQIPSDLQVTEAAQALVLTPISSPEPTIQPTGEPATPPTPMPAAPPTPPTPTPPTPTPSPSPEIRKIGTISSSDVGSTLTIVQAGIADLDYFSAGIKYTLTDGTGQITLLIWQNVLEEVDSRYILFPGSQVRITGQIDQYLDDLEIMPHYGSDLAILDPGQRLPVEERSIANISPADEGRIFVIEGRVTRIESNRWLWVWINDDTGELLVFVPERVVQYLPAGLGQGVRLKVTGEVDIYRGQLEIIPLTGSDIEVR
jgi:DNA/RNA endonuclease YhcR with UshA esterase domain